MISSPPVGYRWQLRTSILMERLNDGIKRRIRARDLSPNEASALRSVVARSPASLYRAA
jgi:transposase-like protein